MRFSQALIPTLKENPSDAEAISHKLMVRAGLIRKLAAGVYSYLPLGLKALRKAEAIVREEMNNAGAQEVLMPALQPAELWRITGRYDILGEELVKFKDRHGKEMVIGPTHEEVITDIAKGEMHSYKDLPMILYQIQTKLRDEPRPRFGVIRSKEFIMKDAYSFHRDEKCLDATYKKMLECYTKIFKRCGLDVVLVSADSGFMGGKESTEFMVFAENGEDMIEVCSKCSYKAAKSNNDLCPKCKEPLKLKTAVEIGHVFKLGTKYTEAMKAEFLDSDGRAKPIIMGCYGIGINRIVAAAIEQHNDEDGIIWPAQIAPYEAIILALNMEDEKVVKEAEKIYKELKAQGIDTLLDDRQLRPGVKFNDADLIGIPLQVIIGTKGLEKNSVEFKIRKTKERKESNVKDAPAQAKKILDSLRVFII